MNRTATKAKPAQRDRHPLVHPGAEREGARQRQGEREGERFVRLGGVFVVHVGGWVSGISRAWRGRWLLEAQGFGCVGCGWVQQHRCGALLGVCECEAG